MIELKLDKKMTFKVHLGINKKIKPIKHVQSQFPMPRTR